MQKTATGRNDAVCYRLFSLRGRPVMAIPLAGGSLKHASLDRFHPVSLRRRFYQLYARIAVCLGLERVAARGVTDPLGGTAGDSFSEWMATVSEALHAPGLSAAVFWPTQPDRGRVYVHLLTQEGRGVAFAKLSLGSDSDERLEREAAVIGEVGDEDGAWRVPRVLLRGRLNGHVYVVLEALPEAARPIPPTPQSFPSRAVADFAGPPRCVTAADLPHLSWWPGYRRQLDQRCGAFDAELRRCTAPGFRVCRAHGDFGPSNVFRVADRDLWILDWEDSAPDAPLRTDEVTFDLGVRVARIRSQPRGALRDFVRRHLHGADRQQRQEILLALAFRSAVAPGDAGRLIRYWDAAP